MVDSSKFIETVGVLVQKLEVSGLSPVMVGGMALVILGSSRVTQDFDFVVRRDEKSQDEILNLFYGFGFELASKLDTHGRIVSTIDNKKVAAIRLRMDAPESVYFYQKKTGLRVDLLFDFPLKAEDLSEKAEIKKIKSFTFKVASKEHLIQLKKIAMKNRSVVADAQDLGFLEGLDE